MLFILPLHSKCRIQELWQRLYGLQCVKYLPLWPVTERYTETLSWSACRYLVLLFYELHSRYWWLLLWNTDFYVKEFILGLNNLGIIKYFIQFHFLYFQPAIWLEHSCRDSPNSFCTLGPLVCVVCIFEPGIPLKVFIFTSMYVNCMSSRFKALLFYWAVRYNVDYYFRFAIYHKIYKI